MTIGPRLHEIRRWLDREFPVPWRVRLRYERMSKAEKGLHGVVYYGSAPLIRIAKPSTRDTAIKTLLHEWAHLRTVKHAGLERQREELHDDEFHLELGRIERAFDESGGRPS